MAGDSHPAYWLMERLPRTRQTASRLGLVILHQMVAALVSAIENPAKQAQVMEVPDIRRAAAGQCFDSSSALSWR
jgi:hypothetical protein